mgnify:CR=1 FL=1
MIVYSRSPLPVITDFSPKEGPDDGGTEVTITGNYFQEGAKVYFGDYESPSVTFLSDQELKAVTPQYPPLGPADVPVRVVNPDMGASASSETFHFFPLWPKITALMPWEGAISGGEKVTVKGERFQEGIRIFFGEEEATQVTFVSETELEVVTPPGREGIVDVRAVNPDGRESVCSGCFTYVLGPLHILRVDPPFGPPGGGNEVTIYGENIATVGAPVVVLFGVALAEVKEARPDRIVCTAPAGTPGPVPIVVTDAAGRVAVLQNGYTYSSESVFIRGEVNGDGRLTVSDARVILKHIFSGFPILCEDAADVNDDSTINIADALKLLSFLFSEGSPPPPPFPNAGPDPTEDSLTCDAVAKL